MKRPLIFLLILFVLGLPLTIFAQKEANLDTIIKKNFIYAELLGKGGYYSLNYERRFLNKNNNHLNVHIGLAYPVGPNFVFKNSVIVMPISVYYSYGKVFQIEAGLGINQYIDFDSYRFAPHNKGKFYSPLFNPSIGFRIENNLHYIFRLTYCPLFDYNKYESKLYIITWLGLSFGYQF